MKLGMKKLGTMMMLGAITLTTVACSQEPAKEDKAPEVTTETEKPEETKEPEEAKSAFPTTITDSTGEEVVVEKEPERIVSLAPSTTEILYFLGEEENIVGRTDYCSYPESMSDVPAVGGTMDPNVESVINLNPDLVVASTHTSQEVITKLREVNIPVAFVNEQESFEGTYSAIQLIGELVGEQEQAEIIVEDMKTSIDEIVKSVEGIEEVPSVYYMMWFGDSDSTAGGDTFIGEMIRLSGGSNIAEDISGWSISKEVLAEKDPEIIIIQEDPTMSLEEKIASIQAMEFYGDLTAVKEGNIYAINPDIISRQAPRLVEALETLVDIIHPELEGDNE